MTTNKPYLTPTEVARMLRVATVTVRMWAQKGMLKAEVTPGGHRRYMLQEVKRFARSHGITLQVANEDQYRVLIVDDEPDWRELLTELLRSNSEDIVIETAADGFEAGRKVSALKPHLVLLDLMMPGIDGAQVCRAIKSDPETSSARVFCISGYIDSENETRLIEAGVERCFAKPVDSSQLLDAIGLGEMKSSTQVANHQ
ncbi:MAG: response regulator [Gammaproteobacteria bacterium]|nr:response regulator [Gammaproteobacteria bacterium]